jgi:hypothetical protein
MRKAAEVILIVIAIILIALLCVNLTSCRQADRVSYNVSLEADSFGVCRKITVINSRTDTIIYELEGVFSLKNSVNNELEIVCRTGENEYKKHFIYLTDTVLYVVEDMQGADVSPYHYKVTFYPKMIGGVDIAIGD